MNAGKGRRCAALLLCLAMMFSMVGAASPAAGEAPSEGLCEHHPEHTAECGYIAPSEGSPCLHVHDAACGYAEPAPETPCDKGCADEDGDGIVDHVSGCAYTPAAEGSPCTHVHDGTCGYAAATEGSPCQYECEICGAAAPSPEPTEDGNTHTHDPEPTEPPADPQAPEGDVLLPQGDPGIDEPSADGGIMPTALTEPKVTVKKADGSDSYEIDSDTPLTWVHNQNYQLNVQANYNEANGGKVKVTVAPGLKITSYYQDVSDSSNFSAVTASTTGNVVGYTLSPDTLEYTVRSTASTIDLNVTLAVDTVLWPKTAGWSIGNAIQVEFFEGEGSAASETRTANVTVNYGVETSSTWNQLYSSDSNNSVPGEAGKEFRMKIFQVSPNLHGQPLGFFYPKLVVTIPYPATQGSPITYAEYVRIDCSNGQQPNTVDDDKTEHTVTFTWENIYVPAGVPFSFTPYFKWGSEQTAGTPVKFSAPNSIKATVTPYNGEPFDFTTGISGGTEQAFTVQGDSAVSVTGRNRSREIYNYGSTEQVYLLGQFQVRNDGFGESGTGPLTLEFTFNDTNIAHVTAQGIPVGSNGGTVTNITYSTNSPAHTKVTANIETAGSYRNTDNNRSYVLMAPEGEYFTEIVATISGIPAQTVCYNNSAAESPNNGAVTFGTIETNGNFTAHLSITGAAVPAEKPASGSYTSIIKNTDKQTTQMQVASGTGSASPFTFHDEPTNTVQLGTSDRTIHYNALISATTYPYTNNQVVDKPVIYLRLPKTIKVSKDGVKLSSVQTGGAGSSEIITSDHYTFEGPLDRGEEDFHVYVITLNDTTGAIGCFNKQLGESQLRLEFDMVADVDIRDMTLKMRDTVFVGYADGSAIDASGSLASSQRADSFDVDDDSNTTEYFSTMTDATAHQLEIKAPRIGLTFNSYAKLSSETDYKNYTAPHDNPEDLTAGGHIMYLTKSEETIDFQFTAENETGSDLSIESSTLGSEDFYYYIPVPKSGAFWDPEHRHIQDNAFQLDMKLAEGVTVTETGTEDSGSLVNVQYSTNAEATDFNSTDPTKLGDLYKDEPDAGNWADVKMIRISVAPGAAGKKFPNGYKATFTVHYHFELNAEELVGYAVEFGPCGVTSYKRNATTASGHTPTQRIRAELQTGRIAGRVFIDEDFSGTYSDGDSMLRYGDDDTFYIETVGSDDLYNKTKDPSEQLADFKLNIQAAPQKKADESTLEDTVRSAQKADFVENTVHNAYDNTYALSSMQARTYTVTVQNPKYTADSVGEDSLRFIALKDGDGGTREVSGSHSPPASTYEVEGTGYQEFVTFEQEVNADDVTANRMRDIGLQRPHKVTFEVTYEDKYPVSSTPGKITQTAYVWHGQAAVAPTFTLDDDFQWQGGDETAQWTTTDGQAAFGSAINSTEREITYTATAVREEHNVIYDDNWSDGEAGNMPANRTAVNGETVTLATEPIPTRSDRPGDKSVVFIGWTSESGRPIVERGAAKKELADSDLNLVTEVTMGSENITVYALWGYDENNNGTADVLEDRYTLTYDANTGTNPPAEVTNLLANEEVSLGGQGSTTVPADPEDKTVVFVGWSENDVVKDQIYGQTDSAQKETINGYVKTSVTMPAGDKTVYAVWAYDENENGTPDYRETLLHLQYYYTRNLDSVTAERPDWLEREQLNYLPGTVVTLWARPGDRTWTGSFSGGKAAFVGWSETEPDQVYETDPTASGVSIVTTVTMNGHKDVYAVWAYDRNDNGEPDYQEAQVTLKYDLNGGTGKEIPEKTGCVAGASYPLADGSGLTRADTPNPAVFAGWSREQHPDIVLETTEGDDRTALGIVQDPYKIPEGTDTVTLYAVYGEDNNGNGRADFMENAHHVDYYPNGGQKPDGTPWPEDEPFTTCTDHHVAGENAELKKVSDMTGTIRRPGAVLIGWSAEKHETPYSDKEEAEDVLIDRIKIPDGEGENAKVYAVWAEDLNNNGTPDYDEPRYSQWYYYNSALTDWVPDESDPDANTKAAPIDAGKVNDKPEGVTEIKYGADALPEDKSDILPGTQVEVPGPTLIDRTDYDADGKVVHHYVQLGWSFFCHPAISSETDMGWVLGDTRSVRTSRFQYNFAAWALDDNNNRTPDFRETPYTLRYDLNGGSGEVPEDQTYLPGLTLELDTASAPVRTQAIFLGWSTAKHEPAVSQAEADAWKAETVTLPAESAEPGKNVVTVYALWAINENAAGDAPDSTTPDYQEMHSLTYDANPIVGAVSGMPEKLSQEYAYGTEVTVTDAKPTHGDVDGKPVVFVGWSDGKAGLARAGSFTIYHAGDKLKIGAYDLTLYAVWTFGEEPADESDTAERTDGAPGTGDEARPELWAALLGLCALAPACLAVPLTKKRRTGR